MAKGQITMKSIEQRIKELYKRGYSPQEIMLALRTSHKTDKEIENIVMKTLKPLFS